MKSSQFYKSTAWKWFSRYVLLSNSSEGIAKCATCNSRKEINDKKIHLGHLIKVFESGANTNFSVAFNEKNVFPQCYQCNVKMGGNELRMLDAIEAKHGEGTYQELRMKSRFPFKLDKFTLDEIAKEYRLKFNELAKKKGNPWK